MRARHYVRSAKAYFKKQQAQPDLNVLEQQRLQLEREVQQQNQIVETRTQIKQLKRQKWRQEHPMMNIMREHLAQGGRKAHAEMNIRTKEFQEQNKLQGGVMGNLNISSLVEEQKRKERDVQERTNR